MVEESIQEGEVRDIGGKIAWADRKKQKQNCLFCLDYK